MMGAAMLKRHRFVQSLLALYRLVVPVLHLFATCTWGSQAQPLFQYTINQCIHFCIAECVDGNPFATKRGTSQMSEMGLMMGFSVNGK